MATSMLSQFHQRLPLTLSSDATASSSPTPTPGGGDSNNSLNAGSVVGVSVVSGLSGFFLVGVAIFFCYRKLMSKRREGKGRDYFEIGGVMSEPLGFGDIPPRRPTPSSARGTHRTALAAVRSWQPQGLIPAEPPPHGTSPGPRPTRVPERSARRQTANCTWTTWDSTSDTSTATGSRRRAPCPSSVGRDPMGAARRRPRRRHSGRSQLWE